MSSFMNLLWMKPQVYLIQQESHSSLNKYEDKQMCHSQTPFFFFFFCRGWGREWTCCTTLTIQVIILIVFPDFHIIKPVSLHSDFAELTNMQVDLFTGSWHALVLKLPLAMLHLCHTSCIHAHIASSQILWFQLQQSLLLSNWGSKFSLQPSTTKCQYVSGAVLLHKW